MISRFDAFLNDVSLLATVPEAMLVDIIYTPAAVTNESIDRGIGDGVIITRRRRQGARVQLVVDLSVYSTYKRQEAANMLAKWAYNGGILKTSDRPGQQLHVRSDVLPSVGSALRWTEQITFSFTADENPYWESIIPSTATITGTGTIYVDGYAGDTKASARITPSGTMTSLTVTCGQTAITLTGISTNKPVVIDYDDYGFLRIVSNNTSLLDKRTGADDLLLPCGKSTSIQVAANVSVNCVISARGLWL